MPYLQDILAQSSDATNWHQQYPWFSIGQLVHCYDQKKEGNIEKSAQQTAVFFNDIIRLNWLLNGSDMTKTMAVENVEAPQTPMPLLEKITPPAETVYEPGRFNASNFTGSEDEAPLDDDEMTEENTDTSGTISKSPFAQSLAAIAGNFKQSAAAEEELIIETAYQHTIDYFASQGINLEGEPEQDDRFGLQLKTFTSWLRQMKRLPEAQASDDDAMVETFAAHSLQKEDVITEPMVDILLKQHKKEQAIDLLEKLRLLHPEKTHYFAARIEQIKHLK